MSAWYYDCEVVEAAKDIKENKETFNVQYCTACNSAYEYNKGVTFHHHDFPSFGLKRQTCKTCAD